MQGLAAATASWGIVYSNPRVTIKADHVGRMVWRPDGLFGADSDGWSGGDIPKHVYDRMTSEQQQEIITTLERLHDLRRASEVTTYRPDYFGRMQAYVGLPK